MLSKEKIVTSTRRWVESVVIDLDLCPFAKKEFRQNSIRFEVTESATESALVDALMSEIMLLDRDVNIETSLLIHPSVLLDFNDYNQFLDIADAVVVELGREGTYQIASFHPQYQYFDTAENDVTNYRNKSPFPMLHLIREASVAIAIDRFPDSDRIPEKNIEHLRSLGLPFMKNLLAAC